MLESATRLGYQPNAIASSLSTRTSNIVGVVVSDMQNPFYPALLECLALELQRSGRQLLLFNAPADTEISEQLALLQQYNVDALVVVSATISSGAALKWAADGRTVVLVNRTVPDAPVNSVCCDNIAGATMIAEHFHALGHRRVAYVAGRPDTSTNIEREHAYTRRVAELGMTLSARVSTGAYTYEAGHAAALEILGQGAEAIFFANDILALGGMDALRDVKGVRIPEDVSIVGFDDIAMASWPRYQLTTVRQPVREMVDITMRLLADHANKVSTAPLIHRIGGDLIIRKTTRALAL